MSEPFKLFQLQQVDSRIDTILKRKAEINQALSSNQKVNEAQKKADQTGKEFEQKSGLLKTAEQTVQEQKVKIEQNQAALYGGKISNPKELQDLQAESESLRKYLEILEERLLEAMLEFEDIEETHTQAEQALKAAQAEAAAENQDLSAELQSLEKDMLIGNADRERMLPQIPAEDLEIYESLRKKRAGLAVARLNGSNCAACGTTLARALAQSAKSPSKISFCTTCGRILYGK